MYDRMFSLVISKDTDERILFRFKGFILKIVDVEKNGKKMSWPSFSQMAIIRHWLLQSAESIHGLEVIISVAHALVHSAFCY